MALREGIDYHAEFSKEGAESVIESAREMLKKSRNILHNHRALNG